MLPKIFAIFNISTYLNNNLAIWDFSHKLLYKIIIWNVTLTAKITKILQYHSFPILQYFTMRVSTTANQIFMNDYKNNNIAFLFYLFNNIACNTPHKYSMCCYSMITWFKFVWHKYAQFIHHLQALLYNDIKQNSFNSLNIESDIMITTWHF